MLEQAARNKARNPSAKVFHYRNIVKALPWFEEVREKLEDPNYWGWFVRWRDDLVNDTTTAGGVLYHDHEQTPGWLDNGGKNGNGGPDGVCHNHTAAPWGAGCDCGVGVPCGEYVFDHRNASLAQWLRGEYMAGARFGLGNELVDGYFLDDDWSVNGPSEFEAGAVAKMGLSDDDVANMTAAWQRNMAACQSAIVEAGGFNWQLFQTEAAPRNASADACREWFVGACDGGSAFQTRAVRFALRVDKRPRPEPWAAPDNATDLAVFLLARGDYAWLGYSWMGCGCGWDDPPDGDMDCAGYPRPESFDVDYGEPLGLCEQTADHVFTREWTKATVSYDCNLMRPSIAMK